MMPGGANQGIAVGRITVDLSSLRASVGEVRVLAQNMTGAMTQVGTSIQTSMNRTVSGIQSVSRGVQQLRGELLGIGAGAVAFTVQGLRAAESVQRIGIQFRTLTGSQEEASRLMNDIASAAQRINAPVLQTQQAMAGLLPYLKEGQADTERWVGLLNRLALAAPGQGTESARFAVVEALSSLQSGGGSGGVSGDFVSLAERFQLSKSILREVTAETGNFADALDAALNAIGMTEAASIELGESLSSSLSRAGDAASRALAVGFAPLIGTVTQGFNATAQFFEQLQQTNPALLQIASGAALVTAGIIPMTLAVSQLVTSFATLKQVAGPALAGLQSGFMTALPMVATIAAGAELGVRVGGRITGQTREEGYDSLGRFFGHVVIMFADEVFGLAEAAAVGTLHVASAIDYLGTSIEVGAAQLAQGFNLATVGIGALLSSIPGMENMGAQMIVGGLQDYSFNNKYILSQQARLEQGATPSQDEINRVTTNISNMRIHTLTAIATELGFIPDAAAGAAQSVQVFTDTVNSMAVSFTGDQLTAFGEYHEQLAKLETDAQQEIEAETQAHAQRREQIIASHEQTVTRMLEDAGISRQRAEAALQRSIQGIYDQRDQAIVDSETQRDERIAEIRATTQQQLLEAELDYGRRRERALAAHSIALIAAASKLDASAVSSLQRGFNLQQQTEQQDFNTQQSRRQQQLNEQISQEEAAHTERVANAMANAEAQIEAQQEQFDLQQQLQAEDAELRLQRMQQDHDDQLSEIDSHHAEKLDDIRQALADERDLLTDSMVDTYNDLATSANNHNVRMIGIARSGYSALEGEFARWIAAQQARLRGSTVQVGTSTNPNQYVPPGQVVRTSYELGTNYVPSTGVYQLHRSEMVLSPQHSAALRRMLGGAVSQDAILAATAAGVSGGGRGGGLIWNGDMIFEGVTDSTSASEFRDIALTVMHDFFNGN